MPQAPAYRVLRGYRAGRRVVPHRRTSVAQAVIAPSSSCSRCGRDDAPLVVNDAGSSLCLGCCEALGDDAKVDPNALAVLRVLTMAKREHPS